MPKSKSKPIAKKKTAEHIMECIKASTVFGNKRKQENPNIGKTLDSVVPFRSDSGKEKIPSSKARVINTFAKQQQTYSGEQQLNVGLGYNKGGFQVLMKTEIKDAGKKTSQLEE